MSKRFKYGPHGEFTGYTSTTSPNTGCGIAIAILILVLICADFLDKALPLLAIAGIGWGLWSWLYANPRKKKEEEQLKQEAQQEQKCQAQMFADEMERKRQELERLRTIPTSSGGVIHGRRIARHIKMVSVDDHRMQDDAELDFLHQVESVGGDAVIHMRIRRHHGGYISVQGDAVKLS